MAKPKTETERRRVKHAMFTYHEYAPNQADPTGDDVLVERVAYHGQEVNLLPHDVRRGEMHEAFFTDDEPQSGPGARFPSQFPHDDLVMWLLNEQPNAQHICNLVNEDPDPIQGAEKMLAAEQEATAGDSRDDVVIGLEAIKQGAEVEERERQNA